MFVNSAFEVLNWSNEVKLTKGNDSSLLAWYVWVGSWVSGMMHGAFVCFALFACLRLPDPPFMFLKSFWCATGNVLMSELDHSSTSAFEQSARFLNWANSLGQSSEAINACLLSRKRFSLKLCPGRHHNAIQRCAPSELPNWIDNKDLQIIGVTSPHSVWITEPLAVGVLNHDPALQKKTVTTC